MSDLPEFQKILTAFNEHSVRVVMIGGVAMRMHGSAHITDDVDFCYARDKANLTLKTDIGIVDLLGEAPGVDSFDGLWARSVEMEAHGIPVHVASLDDLIAMKRAANRPKDQTHVMELEALRRLIQSGAERQDGARS